MLGMRYNAVAMAEDNTLTRTQMNEVYRCVEKCSFDPVEFEWVDEVLGSVRSSWRVSVLRHVPTGYFFMFADGFVKYSPGSHHKVQSYRTSEVSDALESLDTWLQNLHTEYTTPDLWATVSQDKALSTAVSSGEVTNLPITPAEQKLIAVKLDEIRAYIVDRQAGNEDQVATINEEIAYLKGASSRLGRKDWLTILWGGLFSLALALAVTPETAKGMMRLAAEAFRWLWTVIPLIE